MGGGGGPQQQHESEGYNTHVRNFIAACASHNETWLLSLVIKLNMRYAG
jgi:hypothetical protein